MTIRAEDVKSGLVVSVSRRTDIPAFYSDWFMKRIREGYALTANPMNPRQIRKVSLKREDVKCFVFWTKNPETMLPKLSRLEGYPYYFLFTLNPYDERVEPGVPAKPDVIGAFRRLSEMIGPERVLWRYDPILINREMDAGWHAGQFEEMAEKLCKYTNKCILSFVDYYRKIDGCFRKYELIEPGEKEKRDLACRFSRAAQKLGLGLETCAEEIDLTDINISHAHCIDPVLIEKLSGLRMEKATDRNQRKACGCFPSVDIGVYNTCLHGCAYCYANHSGESVKRNRERYDPDSPMLCGRMC